MSDFNLRGKISLDSGDFVSQAAKASNSLNSLNSSVSKASSGLGGFSNSTNTAVSKVRGLSTVLKAVATGALATFIVKLGVDSVRAAQQAGAAQDRLSRLLLNTGGATQEQIGLLNQQARALEALTVVSADNVTTVQSQLATFDLAAGSIATLTPAILDYVVAERGAGASTDEFRSLTNGLAQALNGQFASLTRVGFVLDDATKKQIKSGTEAERADAIVRVLNSTYKDFAKTAGETAGGAQVKLANQINNVKQALGTALLPTVQNITKWMSTKFVPVLENLQAKFADGKSVQKFISFIGNLMKQFVDFGTAIVQMVAPVFESIIVPAVKLAIGAFIGFVKILGIVGRFIQKNITTFQILAGVIVAVTAGVLAYRIQVALVNGVTGLWTKATKALTKVMKGLNLVMKMNPIGFILGVVIALIAGMVMLWNKSEAFRKIVIQVGKVGLTAFAGLLRAIGPVAEGILKIATGPMRLLLKALSYLPGAAGDKARKALDMFNTGLDSVSVWADKAADKIEGFAAGLDKYAKMKVKAPKVEEPKIKAPEMPDLSLFGRSGKLAGESEKDRKAREAQAKRIAGYKEALAKAITDYNDFLNYEFAQAFVNGAEATRDSILKGLDALGKVFDAQAKLVSGKQLETLKKAYAEIEKRTKEEFIPQAEAVAQKITEVSEKLKAAEEKYQDALRIREEGAKKFAEVMRSPFGEPSDLQKSFSNAEATIDSIISMYDNLVDAINKRYEGIEGPGQNALIDFLTNETAQLVSLAKRRDAAANALKEAEDNLAKVLEESAKRKEAASALGDLFKSAFGEMDEITRSIGGMESTVDSIIGMYEKLVDVISRRYEGLDDPEKDKLVEYLTVQTEELVKLARKRDAVARKLASAQDSLESVLSEQASFRGTVTSSLRSFGFALAEVADNNAEQVIRVIKTASGLMITQMSESTSGLDKYFKELRDRAKAVSNFITNIRTLLAKGVSKTLIKELLSAGPMAAGYTAELLATAGADQIAQMNSIYGSLDSLTESFGNEMANLFYGESVAMGKAMVSGYEAEYNSIIKSMDDIKKGIEKKLKPLVEFGEDNAVEMAKAMVKGAKSEYENVMAEMERIRKGIEAKLAPLTDTLYDIGKDSLKAMVDGLTSEKDALILLAAQIAGAISASFQSVAASIYAAIAALSAAQATAAMLPPPETPVVTPPPATQSQIDKAADEHEKTIVNNSLTLNVNNTGTLDEEQLKLKMELWLMKQAQMKF